MLLSLLLLAAPCAFPLPLASHYSSSIRISIAHVRINGAFFLLHCSALLSHSSSTRPCPGFAIALQDLQSVFVNNNYYRDNEGQIADSQFLNAGPVGHLPVLQGLHAAFEADKSSWERKEAPPTRTCLCGMQCRVAPPAAVAPVPPRRTLMPRSADPCPSAGAAAAEEQQSRAEGLPGEEELGGEVSPQGLPAAQPSPQPECPNPLHQGPQAGALPLPMPVLSLMLLVAAAMWMAFLTNAPATSTLSDAALPGESRPCPLPRGCICPGDGWQGARGQLSTDFHFFRNPLALGSTASHTLPPCAALLQSSGVLACSRRQRHARRHAPASSTLHGHLAPGRFRIGNSRANQRQVSGRCVQ